jgi:hypothetical protein
MPCSFWCALLRSASVSHRRRFRSTARCAFDPLLPRPYREAASQRGAHSQYSTVRGGSERRLEGTSRESRRREFLYPCRAWVPSAAAEGAVGVAEIELLEQSRCAYIPRAQARATRLVRQGGRPDRSFPLPVAPWINRLWFDRIQSQVVRLASCGPRRSATRFSNPSC